MLGVSRDMTQRAVAWAMVVFAALSISAWFVPLEDMGPAGDRFRYERLADNLLQHGAYSSCPTPPYKPERERMPGFPAFWAAVKWISGGWENALVIAQAALHALSALALFVIAMGLTKDPKLALITEIAWLLSPTQLAYVFIPGTETLCGAAVAIGLAGLVVFLERGGRGKFLVAFCGLLAAAFARPSYFLLPPFLAFGALVLRRWQAFRALAVLTVGVGLAVLPWTIRNYEAFGRLIPFANNWITWNYCGAVHQYVSDFETDRMVHGVPRPMCLWNYPPGPGYPRDPLNECDAEKMGEFDEMMRTRAIEGFRAHPLEIALVSLTKPFRIWTVLQIVLPTQHTLRRLLASMLLAPFLFGCVLLWRRARHGWLVSGTLLYLSLTTMISPASERYSQPVAFLYFLAIIYVFYGLFRGRRALLEGHWRAIPWP